MSLRPAISIILINLLGVLLAACSPESKFDCLDALGCLSLPPKKSIQIAYLLTLQGPTQTLGNDALPGIEMAIDDHQGMLLDHPIQLIGNNQPCSEASMLTGATQLALLPSLLGVIGPNCPEATGKTAGLLSDAGLTGLSFAAYQVPTNDPSTTPPPGFFHLGVDENHEGRLVAEFAYAQIKARRAAVISDQSNSANALKQAFVDAFQDKGGVVTSQGTIRLEDMDLRPLLASLAEAPPDVLFLPIFEVQGINLLNQIPEFPSLDHLVLVGADSLGVDSFAATAGKRAGGFFIAGPVLHGADYASFQDKWKAKYADSPHSGYHAVAYDAAQILIGAIEKAAFMERDGSLHIGRQALRAAIDTADGFNGLSGSITCNPAQECLVDQELGIYEISARQAERSQWPPKIVWRADQR
jgi:branched-chain amino acid transport system substrate-binding protein